MSNLRHSLENTSSNKEDLEVASKKKKKEDLEGQVPENGGGDSMEERTTPLVDILSIILDPKDKFLQRWNVVFVLSCVIAVSLDPLFFYLAVIKEEKKCIGFDEKLWTIAIVLRSVNDIFYVVHIILQFRTSFIDEKLQKDGKPQLNTDARKIARRYLLSFHFLLDILVILPIPQVVIPSIFSEMRGTKSSDNMKFLNSIVLFQYGPRVFHIYLSWKKLIRSDEKFDRTVRVKAPLNLILYIISGHVLGAFWYFFSAQRLTACWRKACENHNKCGRSSFKCNDDSFGNIPFLTAKCPIYSPNTTSFDFGIFLEALRSGGLESTDFPQKIFYSFWWGMRNLSSFGSNLQTSNYIWENCFALCISIFGLILFLYFMGNLQMYMQWTTNNWKKVDQQRTQKEKIRSWMSNKGLDSKMTSQIMDFIHQRFEADEDVYVENLIPNLPLELQREVKRHICFDLLKNLNIIKDSDLNEDLLHEICASLNPVFYNEHSYIVREGDPIDAVFLITEGTVWSSTSKGIAASRQYAWRLQKGQFFGGELLEWVLTPGYKLSKLPVSSKTFKTHTKVEAFALMANNLDKIVTGHQRSTGTFSGTGTATGTVRQYDNS